MSYVTINGRDYTVPELTFDAICELEENGVYLMGMDKNDRKFATMIRGFTAWIMGTDSSTASMELQAHIANGGNITDIIEATTAAIEESGFFQGQKPADGQPKMNREQRRKEQKNAHRSNTNHTQNS